MSALLGAEEEISPSRMAMQRAASTYRPLNVTFELAQDCNLRCTHCYNFDRKISPQPRSKKPQLSPSEILRTIAQIREAGGLAIAFSGGEAMLHPHLLEFVRETRRLHMAVRLKTNGTLLTNKRVLEIKAAGVTEVDISLYGASSATHDALTRLNGSFAKTIAGLKIAEAHGLEPTLNFVMHRGCVSEFGAMLDLAANLGVKHNVSMELTGRYDGTMDSLDSRLNEEDLRTLYGGDRKAYFTGVLNSGESVQCACARTNAGIGYDGTVYPCIGAPLPAGDLREQSFADIWRGSELFKWIRGLTLKDFRSCAPCELRTFCQRSSGAVLTNTGDYTGKEDWTCRQAALLKELNDDLADSTSVV